MSELNTFRVVAVAAVVALALTACAPGQGGAGGDATPTVPAGSPTAAPGETPTVPAVGTGTPGTGVITGTAVVESVDVRILESFPVQVQVLAKGYLQDSCTKLDTTTQSLDSHTFIVTMTTSRPADLACTQVITPFEEPIPLDVAGLKAGTYTVIVNGVTGTFTLDVDNVLITPTP
jgi:inhibitor of cysteine peptidase